MPLASFLERPRIKRDGARNRLEPTGRIELPTCCLRNSCSTTELRWPSLPL